jgi:hypothetical protein
MPLNESKLLALDEEVEDLYVVLKLDRYASGRLTARDLRSPHIITQILKG